MTTAFRIKHFTRLAYKYGAIKDGIELSCLPYPNYSDRTLTEEELAGLRLSEDNIETVEIELP